MACGCRKGRERWAITLAGGLKIYKATEDLAKAFAAKHPGAVVSKA